MRHVDISAIVLINDNINREAPGDVSVFANERALCLHLEAPYLDDPNELALSMDGDEIVFGTDGSRVIVLLRRPYPNGANLVRTWLAYASGMAPDTPLSSMLEHVRVRSY